MNRVILCGRLTREPEIRYSQTVNGSMAVARYTLAVDRAFKKEGEQAADFINCIAFGKNGEFAERYLHQGTKIIVEGRWQTGSYTNKDGATVYTTDVVADRVEFLEWGDKPQGSSSFSTSGSTSQGSGAESAPAGFSAIDEDIPF